MVSPVSLRTASKELWRGSTGGGGAGGGGEEGGEGGGEGGGAAGNAIRYTSRALETYSAAELNALTRLMQLPMIQHSACAG